MQSLESVQMVQLENGMRVPSLQGRLFCSRRDPVKESESWYKAHELVIQEANEILVLGLGAGFHLLAFEPHRKIHVLELNPELIAIFQSLDLPIKPDIHFVSADTQLEATVVEFRPAWLGNENQYQELSRHFRAASRRSLQSAAESKDLFALADCLEKSQWPENMELSVKDIANLFPLENQTQEAKIWRTLRELVA